MYLKYMRAKITYEGMQRIERYFVPEEALREALLNALCHKQYQSGVPIQISVYEDKLYIANCGCLPENWTLENLMNKHASSPYNPNIAHVFYLAGFIESWGRGIEKICSACEKDGVPQPEYTINPGDIMIKFTAPEDRLIRSVTGDVYKRQPLNNLFISSSFLCFRFHYSKKGIVIFCFRFKDFVLFPCIFLKKSEGPAAPSPLVDIVLPIPLCRKRRLPISVPVDKR